MEKPSQTCLITCTVVLANQRALILALHTIGTVFFRLVAKAFGNGWCH